MFQLFPTFDDKLKQLKHNTLVSYALFQLLLFFIIAILTSKGLIARTVFLTTIFTTLFVSLMVVVFARYKYNLVASLYIISIYLGVTYFMFLIHSSNITSLAIFCVILFAQSILTILIINWPSGLILTILSTILLFVDHALENKGIFNPVPGTPIPTVAFLFIIIPFLMSVVVSALSYIITLNLIFKEYQQELKRRQEYEELLVDKNVAVNEMNSELEESLAQLEESNDQLEVALKKAKESDNLKSSFLQNISHEVRTPLNAIMGFLNLIKENNLKNECNQDEFIDLTIESGRQLLNTISDIVELSEIDAGLITLNEQAVNLEDLLVEIHSNFLHVSESKGIKFILENEIVDQQAFVYTDQSRLTQILNNIVSNGIKFTKSGSVVLSCMLDQDKIKFQVKDTGIGIKPEMMDIIFERFKQVEMDLSRSYGGLGIGLTIVNGLVEYMKGSIDVTSEFGKGSEFTVILPYQPVKKTSDMDVRKTFHPKKITKLLIAEDDAHNYLYLERILKNKKFEILHAWNGKEAVEYFENHADIQLVLMDIKMPVMDGLQAIRKIKKIRSEIPVIAITAYALNEEKVKYKAYGFDGYLTKPVTKESILGLFK